jgi:hypothetical protein
LSFSAKTAIRAYST